MSITTIEDRFVLLLKEQLTNSSEMAGRGFWERLSQRSGITAQRWRKAFDRRQRPTSDIIEATGRLWPHYAFWLATGITDATSGHVAPMTALTFPERHVNESAEAKRYFRMSIELSDELGTQSGIDLEDEQQRMYAAERRKPFAHWIATESLDSAYALADGSRYAEFREQWLAREAERERTLKRLQAFEGGEAAVGSSADGKSKGIATEKFVGVDLRSAHQGVWDLFYIPRNNVEPD